MSTECPTCGRDDFKTNGGMKAHHTKIHGESLAFKTYQCGWCNSEIERQESKVKGQDNVFCDRECKGKWHSKNLSGESHPLYDRVERQCDNCGEPIDVWPTHDNQFEHSFCDTECESKWRSENLTGEENPAWAGGKEKYLGAWKKQRKKALERDEYECTVCSMSSEEHKEKHGKELEVHHIRPIRKFDDYEQANELDNLRTVCKACHGKYEGLPVFPI